MIKTHYLPADIKPYNTVGNEKYVYKLKASDLTHELEKIGELYHAVYKQVKTKYSDTDEFRIFERVFKEHFTIVEGKSKAKPNNELNSSMLQSPDDEDATYRKNESKRAKASLSMQQSRRTLKMTFNY